MAERLKRQELYQLVWSQPMKTLAVRFGISDVALKKTCARAAVPVPGRGHWAKKGAGKRVVQANLPTRPPGMDDEVLVGGGGQYWYRNWTQEELLGLLPNAPAFSEPIESVHKPPSRERRGASREAAVFALLLFVGCSAFRFAI